jgi:hypothetical protein
MKTIIILLCIILFSCKKESIEYIINNDTIILKDSIYTTINNNRNYNWYISQHNTLKADSNCGITCIAMAAKWYNNTNYSVDYLANRFGTGIEIYNIPIALNELQIPCLYSGYINNQSVIDALAHGIIIFNINNNRYKDSHAVIIFKYENNLFKYHDPDRDSIEYTFTNTQLKDTSVYNYFTLVLNKI